MWLGQHNLYIRIRISFKTSLNDTDYFFQSHTAADPWHILSRPLSYIPLGLAMNLSDVDFNDCVQCVIDRMSAYWHNCEEHYHKNSEIMCGKNGMHVFVLLLSVNSCTYEMSKLF